MSQHRPGYKREFCDALPVRMRLAGWAEETCLQALAYAHAVADVYTGNAWRNYARDVDDWLVKQKPANAVSFIAPKTLLPYRFPVRSGVPSYFKLKERTS